EMSKLEGSLLNAQMNQDAEEDSHKKLSEELDGLRPSVEEVERLALSSKFQTANLERAALVRDFLPLAIKKLFSSEHFNCALGDLQQKALTFGRLQALNKVHGLGSSLDFKDVEDYNLDAENI
ncbi:hypothetical protein Tco_0346956, partial [Tanacetum coccineum]